MAVVCVPAAYPERHRVAEMCCKILYMGHNGTYMNTDALKKLLSATLRRVLQPVVRIALRGELTYREFSDIAKRAYFDVARDDFGINGRKTNLARVAILTGLSRKECSRLKSLPPDLATRAQGMSPAARVITAWHEDATFTDANGKPCELPMDGLPCSVNELFRQHGGDIPPGALLTELKRIGAIEQTTNKLWRVLKRSFIAEGFDRDKIRILGNQLTDLGSTIVHNVEARNAQDPRMQRYVLADALSPEDAAEFQQLATRKGQALLEELDAWLAARASPDTERSKDTQRAGVGIYFFQDSTPSGERT